VAILPLPVLITPLDGDIAGPTWDPQLEG